MPQEQAIASGKYLLQKYPGKGGWTYAEIPEVEQNKSNPFGWVKVRGRIDSYELKQYKLMPMGEGKLFLPVKAAIRKKIKKEAGDVVEIVLFLDESPITTPQEILECFAHEPQICLETYNKFPEGEQKAYLDWIYSAKKEETKAKRILEMMEKLKRGERYYEKEQE